VGSVQQGEIRLRISIAIPQLRSVPLTQYCSGDKIEKNEMGGACSAYGGQERLYRVLVGKPEGKRPHGGSRLRWENNIKMDLLKVVCEGMD